ncbi:hypothetical protein [Caballeronia temeraria]|nr:hypothetical protein [Caballeronia temeraria]
MPLQKAAASAAAEEAMKLNPCDRDDSRIGRALVWLTLGTDCRCCIGTRIVVASIIGLAVGAALGRLL